MINKNFYLKNIQYIWGYKYYLVYFSCLSLNTTNNISKLSYLNIKWVYTKLINNINIKYNNTQVVKSVINILLTLKLNLLKNYFLTIANYSIVLLIRGAGYRLFYLKNKHMYKINDENQKKNTDVIHAIATNILQNNNYSDQLIFKINNKSNINFEELDQDILYQQKNIILSELIMDSILLSNFDIKYNEPFTLKSKLQRYKKLSKIVYNERQLLFQDIMKLNNLVDRFESTSRYLIIRAGHSKDLVIPLSTDIFAFSSKKKKNRKLIIYSQNKIKINNLSKYIYNYRRCAVYTGKGVRFKYSRPKRKAVNIDAKTKKRGKERSRG